ncbi:cytochrome b562 [Pasteurellaceae bacterium LIM206]|nr:cytochrome b562 [Pasteurellaceae bacterium LIM206]
MKKINRLIIIALLTAAAIIGFSHITNDGEGVRTEMYQMKAQADQMMNASDTDEFRRAAKALRETTIKAQAIRPSGIHNDTDFKGYQQGMLAFVNVIDEADQLARQGKLDEAKTKAKTLFELKSIYHKKYK